MCQANGDAALSGVSAPFQEGYGVVIRYPVTPNPSALLVDTLKVGTAGLYVIPVKVVVQVPAPVVKPGAVLPL